MDQTLIKLLEQQRNYHWKELQDKLNMYSDEDLICALFDIVDDGIENYNHLAKPKSHHYIEKAVHYLNYRGINDMIEDPKFYIRRINQLIHKTHCLIAGVQIDHKKYYHSVQCLNRILFGLKQSKMKFINQKFRKSDYQNEQDEEFYFLTRVIEEINDYSFLENLFDDYKELVNLVNSEGYCLFDAVIDLYLKCMKSSRNEEKIRYYQAILKLMIYSKNFRINREILLELSDELDHLIFKIKDSDLNTQEKKWRIYYLEELISVLKIKRGPREVKFQLEELNQKYVVKRGYPKEIMEEFQHLSFPSDLEVQDDRDVLVYTIDKAGTVLKDDGYAFKKFEDGSYELTMYYPLVADYIPRKGVLDQFLRSQGETLRASNFVKFLFTKRVSSTYFSLDEGKERYALAIHFKFDSNNHCHDISFDRAKIKIHKNFTFEEVDELLHQNLDSDVKEWLTSLTSIIKNLPTAQDNRWGLNDTREHIFKLSHFVNVEIADLMKRKQIPFVYRKYDSRYIFKKLVELQQQMGLEKNSFVNSVIYIACTRTYSKRTYTTDASENRIIASITNPIHEYASIVSQYLILQYFIDHDRPIKLYNNELDTVAKQLDHRHQCYRHFISERKQLVETLDLEQGILKQKSEQKGKTLVKRIDKYN